ncbi:hypothetical protein [Halocatena halophila]|uniref:hypothetical protein n=1 Tax=Halocatena halophila TaxID=2814576 RepID=UPI002ED000EE
MELPDDLRDALESHPNVIGTCLGTRRVGGQPTDEPAVIVLVSKKRPVAQLAASDRIPETVDIDGETIPTDVQEIGEPRIHAGVVRQPPLSETDRTARWRPAPAGVSIGHEDVTAGTLGTPVLHTETDDPVVLTNAHVAAPIGGSNEGAPIYQPGPMDGGTTDDRIGTLKTSATIDSEEPNTTDSALVSVRPGRIDHRILGIGQLVGFEKEPSADATFHKSGRTTGVTSGRRRGHDARVRVGGYYDSPVTFEGVTIFDPMSTGGDSGSLIGIHRSDGFYGTDLLFAGSDRVTLAVPIAAVEAAHGPLEVTRPADTTQKFSDRVGHRLRAAYGTANVSPTDGAASYVVSTPMVRLVVAVATDRASFDRAVTTAIAARDSHNGVPVVVHPEGLLEAATIEAISYHVCLVSL